MAYQKTHWESRDGENLDKFTKVDETANSVILINSPDLVIRAGTPFSTENMNKIENGIADAHNLIAAEAHQRQTALRALEDYIQYLSEFIESKLGSAASTIPLVTESGYYLVTEDNDYFVVA